MHFAKKFINTSLLFILTLCYLTLDAQNTRITDKNKIGWYAYNGTFNLNKNWGIYTEYQWRRDGVITDAQQSLFKTGINYKPNQKLLLRLGYGLIETYNYGDIPINAFGKQFTEHRIFQMATISDNIGKVGVAHRFMLEQRWVGTYTNAQLKKEDKFIFSNRLRYMYRMQMPLKGKSINDKAPYAVIYDEIFIGFGKNVNENVFDQNRLGILLGYQFNSNLKVEGGFLSQVAQLGREVNGSNVFQYNNGVLLSIIINSDLLKKSE